MAGGVGSRFWPISRQSKPKQFLDILGTGKTFLRATYERFLPIIPPENFLVVTNAAYKSLVMEQIPELAESQVLCEPIGRNTAPAIAYAAFRLNAVDPEAEMIVTPSDHMILDAGIFRGLISEGLSYLKGCDAMMTIGVTPTSPNTGYGYIQADRPSCGAGVAKVKTFTEKPDAATARAFVESGEFFWNSGIFIWHVNTFLTALRDFLPEVYQLFNSILPYYDTPREYESVQRIYPECRAVSVDIGIMEKARNVYVVCGDFGWSDIGTWNSLYEHSPKDEQGNVCPPESALYDTSGCVVKLPEGKLAVIEGLHDYIVVENGNVLMICPRGGEQNIKRYIEDLKFRDVDGVV